MLLPGCCCRRRRQMMMLAPGRRCGVVQYMMTIATRPKATHVLECSKLLLLESQQPGGYLKQEALTDELDTSTGSLCWSYLHFFTQEVSLMVRSVQYNNACLFLQVDGAVFSVALWYTAKALLL